MEWIISLKVKYGWGSILLWICMRRIVLLLILSLLLTNTMDGVKNNRITYSKINLRWDEYPDYETFFDTIKKFEVEYPDLIEVFPIGKSRLNRTI